MTTRARKRLAQAKEAERLEEIREYFEATETDPNRPFKVYGEFNTYISNPKTLAVIRAALERELNGDMA